MKFQWYYSRFSWSFEVLCRLSVLLTALSKDDCKSLVSFEQIQNFKVLHFLMANVRKVNITVTYWKEDSVWYEWLVYNSFLFLHPQNQKFIKVKLCLSVNGNVQQVWQFDSLTVWQFELFYKPPQMTAPFKGLLLSNLANFIVFKSRRLVFESVTFWR